VRVVAATHRDLASLVAHGKFREDLWYRVAVFPILLPPLRERRSDIPELAFHFAERAANRFGLSPVKPTAKDIELLQSYHWPGNIRELGAVIDRAAILGDGKSLEVPAALGLGNQQMHSPEASSNPAGQAESFATGTSQPESTTARYPQASSNNLSIDIAMRRHIEFVLEKTRGKVEGHGGAAELLEINPHTLRARMRKLKIKWVKFRQFD
ncbi:MAG: sigma 54-interacting transcriptional regulator, partial [Aureliella sp.]